MKKLLFSFLAFVSLTFAQTVTSDQYWAAQPPQVRALRNMDTTTADRGMLAAELAQKGFTIDVPIMVYGWDAAIVMTIREADGLTWVPSALQPNIGYQVPGGPTNPPYVPYDPNNRPSGSIKVSTASPDYPPFDPPAPPKPAPATNVVGAKLFGNVYGTGPGAMKDSKTANVVDGQVVPNGSMSCTAHVAMALMGLSIYFTCN